jgi:hypothetical protein
MVADSALSMTEVARAKRARRRAARLGLAILKDRGSGGWHIVNPHRDAVVCTLPDLDAVEAWLTAEE